MAIQMRRGSYDNFDKTKMLAGEWAVVQDDDPAAKDGTSVYMAFAAGDVKRMATYTDMVDNCKTAIEANEAEIIKTLTDGVKTVNDKVTTDESARAAAERQRGSQDRRDGSCRSRVRKGRGGEEARGRPAQEQHRPGTEQRGCTRTHVPRVLRIRVQGRRGGRPAQRPDARRERRRHVPHTHAQRRER